MKTKELIRQLQEADPSGEVECSVGNVDIHHVELLPAYYDGRQQVLIRDEDCKFYNIVGAKVRSTGSKVFIKTLSITDAIWNDTDLPVDYSDLSPQTAAEYKKAHDRLRQEVKDFEDQLELEYFTKHVRERLAEVTDDQEDVDEACREFFKANLSRHHPMPDDICKLQESYVGKRNAQWKREVAVGYGKDGVVLNKVNSEPVRV